jgi:hypothetical protein
MVDDKCYTIPMTLRDWVLFLFTLVVAILCGMYLYFTTFVPVYVANPIVTEVAERTSPEWELTMRPYGGCSMTNRCPAFFLSANGSYRYQPSADAPLETGTVPRGIVRSYNALFTPEYLLTHSAVAAGENCRSFVDGLDYRMLVDTRTGEYVLDTCGTNVGYDDEVIAITNRTFAYMENPDTYEPTEEEFNVTGGLQGLIEQRLDEAFTYDDEE